MEVLGTRMEAGFEFTERNGGAIVTAITDAGTVCILPETLGGLPVTGLAERLFAGSGVQEIFLPRSLKQIGRYGFYNCMELRRLHLHSALTELGGGALNGCYAIQELFVHMDGEEPPALRDFVTEINRRVTVHYLFPNHNGGEQEIMRLIFPVYYDEAVENTPARITISNIHGSGQKYRYCFENRRIQLDRYDRIFVYETAEEDILAAAELALCRLRYPYRLSESAKEDYEKFIEKRLFDVLTGNLRDVDTMKWLIVHFLENRETPLLTENEMETLIFAASGQRLAELSAVLMEQKRRFFGRTQRKFDF